MHFGRAPWGDGGHHLIGLGLTSREIDRLTAGETLRARLSFLSGRAAGWVVGVASETRRFRRQMSQGLLQAVAMAGGSDVRFLLVLTDEMRTLIRGGLPWRITPDKSPLTFLLFPAESPDDVERVFRGVGWDGADPAIRRDADADGETRL